MTFAFTCGDQGFRTFQAAKAFALASGPGSTVQSVLTHATLAWVGQDGSWHLTDN